MPNRSATSLLRSVKVAFMATCIAAAALALPSSAVAAKAVDPVIQKVADHFSGIRTLKGTFVQYDASGNTSSGTFQIMRPGNIRFDYANSALRIIADGSQVAINNRKLNTWDLYPLSKTPMKLLLGNRIDLSGANIRSVKQTDDAVTIVLGDRSVFGDSEITLVFDARTYAIRQWTLRDQRGRDTRVVVGDVVEDAKVDRKIFAIPYTAISLGQTGNRK